MMISDRQNRWMLNLWRVTAFTWLGMLLAMNVGGLWLLLFPVSQKRRG